MSSVIATPELVRGAAESLKAIRSSLDGVADTISGPTVGIVAAAQDEVSTALASIFSSFGREFQAVNADAEEFHARFVQLLNASAAGYANAEIAGAQTLLAGGLGLNAPSRAPAAGTEVSPLSRWTEILDTTARNAQSSFSASGRRRLPCPPQHRLGMPQHR